MQRPFHGEPLHGRPRRTDIMADKNPGPRIRVQPAEETPMLRTHRSLLALLAVLAALVLTVVSVDARSSGSSGSRGGRTFSAPAATQTAPRAAPIERSMAQPARPGTAATQTTGAAGQVARP